MGEEALTLLRKRQIAVLMVFALLATWGSVWQVAYLPFYYGVVLGSGVLEAGLIAAAVLLAGLLGKLALGSISDSMRRDRLLLVLSSIVAVLYLIFFSTQSFLIGIAAALAMGFFGSAVFPVMQALVADSSGGFTGAALGLTTTFQSVAAVFSTFIAAALFGLGVGRGIALDAMVPAIAMVGVSLLLRDTRSRGRAE